VAVTRGLGLPRVGQGGEPLSWRHPTLAAKDSISRRRASSNLFACVDEANRSALRSDTRLLFGGGLFKRAWLVKVSVLFTFASIALLRFFVNDLKRQATLLPFALRALMYFACLFGVWLQLHNSFAMLYAKLYYDLNSQPAARGGDPQGFIFAGSDEPVFSDFLYVSYAVGLTYAMSDTNLEDSKVRRIVLLHSLASFLFLSIVLNELIHLLGSL
jgi:hypothetical protein